MSTAEDHECQFVQGLSIPQYHDTLAPSGSTYYITITIDGLQSTPWQSNDKDVAAMLDELTIEADDKSFVIVLQHGAQQWRHMKTIYYQYQYYHHYHTFHLGFWCDITKYEHNPSTAMLFIQSLSQLQPFCCIDVQNTHLM